MGKKLSEHAEKSDAESAVVATAPGVRTAHVAVFVLLAFIVLPLGTVVLAGDTNLYTRMEQWYALHLSLQSNDPGRIAIDDPEADIAFITSFLEPGPGRSDRAVAVHTRWRENRNWSIRDGELRNFEISDDGTLGTIVLYLKMDTPKEGGEDVKEVVETSRWVKIGRDWYMTSLDSELINHYFRPRPSIVRP